MRRFTEIRSLQKFASVDVTTTSHRNAASSIDRPIGIDAQLIWLSGRLS